MNINKELIIIRTLLNKTQEELAKELGITYKTITRWELERNSIETYNVEKVYEYAYKNGILLNAIYEQLLIEENQKENNKVLFHGCKSNEINFPLDLNHSRDTNDFGKGFYLGESFKQAATYIANSKSPSVYAFKLNMTNLTYYQFSVNKEWMIAIAYYRNWLKEYEKNEYVQSIISKVENKDLVIAPIADNRMFDIISEFVRGEITDLQCEHALAATNLGFQYVLRTNKALDALSLLRYCYVAKSEKENYVKEKLDFNNQGINKVKIARIEYKGKGQYIDELLK